MVARGRGGVLNLSSVGGFVPRPRMALYFASKGFVRLFRRSLSRGPANRGHHYLRGTEIALESEEGRSLEQLLPLRVAGHSL